MSTEIKSGWIFESQLDATEKHFASKGDYKSAYILLSSMLRYEMTGEEPEFENETIQILFEFIKPTIDKRVMLKKNGKLGGRPKKAQESVQNVPEYNCTTQREKASQIASICPTEGVSDIISTQSVEPVKKEVDEREIIDDIKDMISDGNGGISADGTSVVHDNIGYLCRTYNITEEDVYKRDGYYSRAINEIKSFKHEEAIFPF